MEEGDGSEKHKGNRHDRTILHERIDDNGKEYSEEQE